MSKFLNRKTLIGSAFAVSLLGVMQMPIAVASGDHGEHEHSTAPVANSTGKPAPQQKGQAADSRKMDHGSMNHGSMDHSKMAHGSMNHEPKANKADADRDHDQ
ncbi:hypothetical protein [Pseudomonas sp. 2FG]|uniref:hypothetical protein n=1 Tax=Pseudomonas sp. 2FG TaxID=2502191 RepID=UPI0010F4E3BB|nr:hypothetical protein [Pseudomonas sp. 2FG]